MCKKKILDQMIKKWMKMKNGLKTQKKNLLEILITLKIETISKTINITYIIKLWQKV